MQLRDPIFDVEMHDHGGVLPVGPARDVGVPAGFDQTHERITGGRQRRPVFGGRLVVVVVAFPLRDRGIQM